MIQILTYGAKETELKGKETVVNRIHDAQSLDEFEINIIDMSDISFWKRHQDKIGEINEIKDLDSMSQMLINSSKCKNIILLPQNVIFAYDYYNGRYLETCELKDMIRSMTVDTMGRLHKSIKGLNIVYENTKTKIEGNIFSASFYFHGVSKEKILTRSEKSDKPTTIQENGVILSTLKLNNYQEILSFLRGTGLIKDKQEFPAWMEEVKMFDDNKQLQVIEDNNIIIKNANANISKAMEVINKNNEYKSILYTNGDELVNVVFEILEEMLGCDLSDFVDKKNEDFLFDIDGTTFIGEIKGVNHNVKNENVSQLDVHYQGYFDDHEEATENNVKALLIMNHQKNKPIFNREPVHENQIGLAKRNGSLIIETITLLKLFEQYLSNKKTREECINILKDNTGLLILQE